LEITRRSRIKSLELRMGSKTPPVYRDQDGSFR
jgi:hypothetical protein